MVAVPSQMFTSPLTWAVTEGSTVTSVVPELEHPLSDVASTVYRPAFDRRKGENWIAPEDAVKLAGPVQEYVAAPVTDKVRLLFSHPDIFEAKFNTGSANIFTVNILDAVRQDAKLKFEDSPISILY